MESAQPDRIDPAAIAPEIDRLVQALAAEPSAVGAQAQELVRLMMQLYGAGLARMLDVVRTEGGGPNAVLDRLAADGLVASLLVLHDLHPRPLQARVEQALAELAPYLPPTVHVAMVAAAGDTVRLRVSGASGGAGAANLRSSLERAVLEAAPELAAVDIEGLEATGLLQIIRPSRS